MNTSEMDYDQLSQNERDLLDMALEGQPDAFKVKVYQIVHKLKVSVDDPIFLLMIGTGRVQLLLEQYPDDVGQLLDENLEQFKDVFRKTFSHINSLNQELKESSGQVKQSFTTGLHQLDTTFMEKAVELEKALKHYEAAAVQNQEKAIAMSVNRLVHQGNAVAKSSMLTSLILPTFSIICAVWMVGFGTGWVMKGIPWDIDDRLKILSGLLFTAGAGAGAGWYLKGLNDLD
jgi:hypothetical protein